MRETDGLEIDQNLAFQRREWRVQRLGWGLLGAFVLAAALGLFGNGVLSRAEIHAADAALSIRYERFIRAGAPTRLTVLVRGPGPLELHMSRDYFDRLTIDRITPEPASLDVGSDEVRLTFRAGGTDTSTILIDAEPRRAGRYHGAFRVSSGPTVRFTQLAYF